MLQHGPIVDQTLAILQSCIPSTPTPTCRRSARTSRRACRPFNADIAPGPDPQHHRRPHRQPARPHGPELHASTRPARRRWSRSTRGARSCAAASATWRWSGGVHDCHPAPILMLFCQLGALSRRGQIRPFDKRRRRHPARRGRRHRGAQAPARRRARRRPHLRRDQAASGVASDGRGVGVMAPRLDGEVLALRAGLRVGRRRPRAPSGSSRRTAPARRWATRTEIQALARVFGARAEPGAWCALGSVKSMIGHAMPAAGIAGLIKAALALHHKVLPPTLNVRGAQPGARAGDARRSTSTPRPAPGIHGAAEAPRRAGVNAFGFGGINAHAILEECPPAADAAAASRPAALGQRGVHPGRPPRGPS